MDPFDPRFDPNQQPAAYVPPSPEEERRAKRGWIIINLMPSLIRAMPHDSEDVIVTKARTLAELLLEDL